MFIYRKFFTLKKIKAYLKNKMQAQKIKISLIQSPHFIDKQVTLSNLEKLITEAAENKAKYVFLGECFNSLYRKDALHANSEDFSSHTSPTISLLRKLSKSLEIFVLGSLPELDPLTQNHYNTAVCFNPSGELIAKHRKLHLFDIDIPGKITSKESETFQSGSQITVFEAGPVKIGMAICYDLRFPELSLIMTKKGAQILFFPAAFNQTTGPLHWDLLLRSRALDNQVYVVGVSPARFQEDPTYYQAWGHSGVADPMGKIMVSCEQEVTILYQEVDLEYIEQVRTQLPYQKQKRLDLYKVEEL